MRVVAKSHKALAITLTPGPRSAPHGMACKPCRLQRRKACFAKPRFRPAGGRRETIKRIIPEISARRREASGFKRHWIPALAGARRVE